MKKLRVLLVDDEIMIREGFKKLFTKENIFQFVPALVWQVIRRPVLIRENY